MSIRKIKARQIYDSRGEPTLEVDLITDIGLLRSSVPSGSLNPDEQEAKESRDGDGHSVQTAVEAINGLIGPEIIKSRLSVSQQREIDALMLRLDGTPDKSKLGANAILAVSVACCKAAAAKRGLPLYRYIASLSDVADVCLPVPVFQVMSGGRAAANSLAYQEFLILPTGAANFAEAMRMGTEVYRELERFLVEQFEMGLPLPLSHKGGYVPTLVDDSEALSALNEVIKLGHEGKLTIGLDVAASAFLTESGAYDPAYKTNESDPSEYLSAQDMCARYLEHVAEFPALASLEDPLDRANCDDWPLLARQLPEHVQLVADDLVAMNAELLDAAIEREAAHCLTLRPIQIGTVTESVDLAKQARAAGWSIRVSSGRRGETDDTFVADLAVGLGAEQFKAGAPGRGKYNQLLRIEEELGASAIYAGTRQHSPSPVQ